MPNLFLQMLEHLRYYEEVMLFGNILQVSAEENEEAIVYLTSEYKKELLEYPFEAPPFDPQAALWAAKTIYIATQLLLYREHKDSDLETLLPAYDGEITAPAMTSADLLLRFLPDVLTHLKMIDPDDKLIEILESHLHTWHYSAVAYSLSTESLHFEPVIASKCLHQLYINRVIEYKKLSLARHPALAEGIRASLGIFASELWKDFQQEYITKNEHYS